uniref:Vitellinogen open beta-sheet domain-containing protein n=1 Tax=Accipiter nisus TaxID=211598 RepID=A0A8B9NB14_9AVES
MRTLGKFLGGNCTVQDSEQLSEMQLVLKAIGNAGLAAASLAPVLSLCASLKSNPIEIRLAAIQAFRRIPCSVRNAILVQLYQATNEDVEIRIAAYYIAMKCPHEELFKQVQKTLLKETSSQVGSFVWSHLSQLLETDDPLKEHLRDSIPDEILSRDFDRETWKYSSYSDVTFHSAGAGANMEASVVFSPASFLPRSVMTNLTVHLMGQAINLLEVDVRLENAEALMQKILGQKSATFSDYFFANTNERNHKSENPVETTGKVNQRKLTLKRYSPTDYLVTKSGKPKLRKANQNCPSRKYSKMSELVKKFTERTERKEVLKCELSMKIFGNELSFLDCEDLRKQMKHYSLNLAELAVKLLKGQEVQFNKRLSLATEELQFPAISGVPVQLAVNASAAINIKIKGNADFKEQSNFFLNGYIKPSAFVQLSAQMGTVGTLGQAGLSWLTGMRTSSSLDGGIQVKKGQELKVFLNTPEESMEIINFSSKLYFTVVDEMEDTDVFQDHTETRSCTGERVSEILGWQLCSEMSYPDPASGLVFPLTGPLRVAVTLTKQDRGLQQYVMEAACNYVPQENSWIPNEAVLHFFIGTPKSDLKRDVGVDLNFSVPQKKFRIRFIQPKKKIEIDGRIEFSKNSRIGHLELIVDDRDVYYIKVHLKHEASASWLSSQIEVNYGKHWDEINNKKKLLISQAFKNRSSSSLVNYFMEFTMQVLEKQVNYRTQLQHSHNSQVYLQSSTNFEVQYNDHMPFVAGLQWKDASRNGLKKWEGGLNIDTPWLYLYAAHKLHQPHHSTYLLTMELTTGKALSIKNLLVELFYKDQDNEKEGKVHIYTPATTYLQASTFNHLGRNVLHSYSEMISLWNQLVKNEIHLENNERAKFLCFKIKSTKQEFNFTASYQNLPMPKKTNFSLRTVWRDYKSLPVMLQFEGQIEELKKEKMLYQKCGTLHFRHPFKVPILQSFLLQETFTVDKKQKHYFLETKVLINGEEETVQTLRLGYQPENPYICAGLTHPYNYRLFPKDVEICILTQSHQNVKHELETTLKVNKEDVLSFLGGYQDKSSEADFRHLLHMDVTHSFQLEFPQAVGLSGELFSRQTKLEHFDYSVSVKAIINKNVSSQAQAALKSYGESNFNGSLYLHSNGRDMLMLEVDMNNENRKNARVVELRAFLHQIILTNPESVQFQLMGKIFPSRLLISSDVKLNENRLHMDFTGAREQKAGFVLSLNGRVHHTFVGLKTIPHLLSLSGLLKCKNNIHDGNINVMVNKTLYGLRLRNRNVFGNATVHNITFAMFQNGSQAIPMEAKLKGHLELSKEMKRGLASFQVDEKALSVDFSNIMSHGHSRVSGTFTHNISFLKNAGLPLDGILTAMCDHGRRNHTITIALQSGSERITAVFGGHRLSADPPKSQLSMSLKHNISKIKKHGIPFIVEAAGYYENFTRKIAAGITTTVEMEQLKIEIEKKTTGSAMEISLSLHHDVGGLTDIVPRVLEVACSGESANKQLSGLCNGAITFHHFETPARVSVNGSMFTSNFTVVFFGHVSFHDMFAWLQLHATTNIQPHLEIAFQHSLPLLQSLGIARENQVKVSAMRSEKYKVMLGIVLGPCSLKADGEVSLASNETDTEWVLTFRNKCVSLERMGLPHAVAFEGSFQQNICNIGLLMNLQCDGRTVDVQIDTSCEHEYTAQGMLRHSVHWLSQLGLPFENSLLLSAATDSTTEGILLLQAGKCKFKARGDLFIQNKAEWTLETETECQLLQDLSIPNQSRLTGSIQKDKCQAELLCVLEAEGKTAHLEVRTECKPKITLEIHFKHDLPQLKEIPRENKLSITAQNQLKYHVRIGMKLGDCELQMNGDFDPEKKLQWKMFLENKCQTIQDLGAPLKIDGSGYVLMDKMNLESQTLISVDESKLQGLIILKVTDERQELDAVLTHNIQGAADIGIPMRMLVDVISEKTSDCYKRLINFCVNSKQVTEELSFVQKLDVLSLNYQFTHNIEALKTLQIKDRIELQAILNLKVIKSFSMKVHYGAHLTVLKGQIQEFETNTNITGNFHHNWPWLLQARVPPSLQIDVVFQGRNTTRERYVHIAAGETSIIYIINSYYVGHQVDIFCQSIHSSEALQAFGYPKAINLILSLQKSETKAKTICEIQYDDKDITVTMDVDTDFQLCGKFEFMAEVKHSISFFHHLGLPFFLKVTIQEVLTENETEGALRLTYEQNTNFSFTISRKKDQQGEELNIKALQTHPVFLQYFPGAAELSSKVNYDMSEAKGKLYLSMEKRDFNVTAKLTFTGTSYNNVIEIIQTMSQLKILPRQLVFMTVYQKGNRTRMLRHIALWDGKEIKLTGTYTGLFPKLPGGHDVQVELFHPLSIPFPWHARVNLYVKHSARSHRDDLTVIWNENDQISVSSSLKFGKDRMNYRATVAHPFNYTLKQLEVHSLSERRGRKYNQQLQLAGNGGQPADIRLTLEDKSKVNITAWDGCMTLSSGQLQRVLSMEHLHACGSLEQRSALFNEYLDLNWDDKKFKHNLTYEVGEGSCIC